jgi:hypothetical protein
MSTMSRWHRCAAYAHTHVLAVRAAPHRSSALTLVRSWHALCALAASHRRRQCADVGGGGRERGATQGESGERRSSRSSVRGAVHRDGAGAQAAGALQGLPVAGVQRRGGHVSRCSHWLPVGAALKCCNIDRSQQPLLSRCCSRCMQARLRLHSPGAFLHRCSPRARTRVTRAHATASLSAAHRKSYAATAARKHCVCPPFTGTGATRGATSRCSAWGGGGRACPRPRGRRARTPPSPRTSKGRMETGARSSSSSGWTSPTLR